MISLKRLDFFGQLILLFAAIVLIIISPNNFLAPGYIAVGSWQFLSCLLHYLLRNNLLRQKSRYFFEAILIAVPVFVMVFFFYPGIFRMATSILTWLSPVLAVWYYYITYVEMNIWEARALIQLR